MGGGNYWQCRIVHAIGGQWHHSIFEKIIVRSRSVNSAIPQMANLQIPSPIVLFGVQASRSNVQDLKHTG